MSETHGNSSDHHGHEPPVPEEPKTPMWLPALGAVLFLTVGLIWGIMPSSKSETGEGSGATGGAANTAADAGAPARR